MNAKRDSDGQPASVQTLGDVLYAEASAPVSEQDWVRLVEAIAGGDQRALRALYDRTHRIVFTLAMRICANRELAEETAVDVYHDVWRRAAQYHASGGSVVGWIMMQVRSRAIDRVRFEQRKKRVPPDAGKGDEQIEPTGPADNLDARRRRHQLQGALSSLTPDERQAIETAFFSGLTYSETAAQLAEPLGTVKTRVRSALAKLRKTLASDGGDA